MNACTRKPTLPWSNTDKIFIKDSYKITIKYSDRILTKYIITRNICQECRHSPNISLYSSPCFKYRLIPNSDIIQNSKVQRFRKYFDTILPRILKESYWIEALAKMLDNFTKTRKPSWPRLHRLVHYIIYWYDLLSHLGSS